MVELQETEIHEVTVDTRSVAAITRYRIILFLELHCGAHLDIILTAQVEFHPLQSFNLSFMSK